MKNYYVVLSKEVLINSSKSSNDNADNVVYMKSSSVVDTYLLGDDMMYVKTSLRIKDDGKKIVKLSFSYKGMVFTVNNSDVLTDALTDKNHLTELKKNALIRGTKNEKLIIQIYDSRSALLCKVNSNNTLQMIKMSTYDLMNFMYYICMSCESTYHEHMDKLCIE